MDYVLITHNHYDHLEAATLRALKDRDALFIVPLADICAPDFLPQARLPAVCTALPDSIPADCLMRWSLAASQEKRRQSAFDLRAAPHVEKDSAGQLPAESLI